MEGWVRVMTGELPALRERGWCWIALIAFLSFFTLVWQPLVARVSVSPSWLVDNQLIRSRPSSLLAPQISKLCDPFSDGEWVKNASHAPLYKSSSCPFVEESFGCSAHGRPDFEFTQWTWRPRFCPLPSFNGRQLLEHLRGKRMVFVGDSLSRNQWESMLCLLFEALSDRTRVVEASGQALEVTKDKGAFRFIFLDYDCQLEYYSSHFLVEEEYDSSTSRLRAVRLDRVHVSRSHWTNADVLVFTTGHWWTHGKTARGRYFYRVGNELYPKLNLMVAFKMALQTWAAWVDSHVREETARVFLVGYSPGHYRGGGWNRGGACQSAVQPISNESQVPKYPEKMQVIEEIVRCMKFPVKLLNITRLSSYRSDGHPSIYGLMNMHGYQDCSHWCLPGVPDVWNVLLYSLLITNSSAKSVGHISKI